MTAYNPAEIERLVREAKEDDAGMTPGPWEVRGGINGALFAIRPGADRHYETQSVTSTPDYGSNLGRIARTRNNLRVMADQLEAADVEIVSLRDERDVACTEADRLRAQNRSLCDALAVAQARMHAADQRCRTVGEITDEALGLLFGLLTSTGQDRMNINDRRILIQVAERLQRVQRETSK